MPIFTHPTEKTETEMQIGSKNIGFWRKKKTN